MVRPDGVPGRAERLRPAGRPAARRAAEHDPGYGLYRDAYYDWDDGNYWTAYLEFVGGNIDVALTACSLGSSSVGKEVLKSGVWAGLKMAGRNLGVLAARDATEVAARDAARWSLARGVAKGAAWGAGIGGLHGGVVGYGSGGWDGAWSGAWRGALAGAAVGGAVGAAFWVIDPTCFAAGTPIAVPKNPADPAAGWTSKPVEELKKRDRVLSRPEGDPDGPVEVREVEAVFVRRGLVLELAVDGRTIRTTAEHPFFARDRGWTAAGELRPGDLLAGLDAGRWAAVEAVADTGRVETVYNLRVAGHHTYFVGRPEWGFGVWAHNAYREFSNVLRKRGVDREVIRDAFGNIRAGEVGEARAALRTALDNGKRSPEAIERMIDRALSQVDSLTRPSEWRAGFAEKVEAGMPTTPDGKPTIYDLVDGRVVRRERLPGEYGEIGHIEGVEHHRLVRENAGMTQPEFNELLHNNPQWFRIETRRLAASHMGEAR